MIPVRHHLERTGRTVFGTGPAACAVGHDHATLPVIPHLADPAMVLLVGGQFFQRAGRTEIRTVAAFELAFADFKGKHRLPHPGQSVFEEGRFQGVSGTVCDTQSAARAAAQEFVAAAGSGRHHRRHAAGGFPR